MGSSLKVSWQGVLVAIQPRIRLMRSFDERAHAYLGYSLFIQGTIGDNDAEFSVGIGKEAQVKFGFRAGDIISGNSVPIVDTRMESVEYYKTSGLKLVRRVEIEREKSPPWLGEPPELTVYRERGHRRLDSKTYTAKCHRCIWGCRMPAEITVDHWKPHIKQHRYETFCYGPKSCSFYHAGPTRKVPGRRGMTWEEEDWVDEDAVSHRDEDE